VPLKLIKILNLSLNNLCHPCHHLKVFLPRVPLPSARCGRTVVLENPVMPFQLLGLIVESWANTTHPNEGGDLSLYRPYRLGVQVRVQIQYKTIYNSIYLTPARSRRGSITNTKTGPKISKQLYRKTLSHDISILM